MPQSRVVDANALRSSELLESFLLEDSGNRVIVTDFCAMESYKGAAEVTLARSMEILKQFPRQVAVLKGTKEVIAISTGSALAPDSLIDTEQSAEFAVFCEHLQLALAGDEIRLLQLRAHAKVANDYLLRVRGEVAGISQAIMELQSELPQSTLKRLRRSEPPALEDAEVFVSGMLTMADEFFKSYAEYGVVPTPEFLGQSFILRFAVASYVLALDWIRNGGYAGTSDGRFANDVVDMNYVAYATYFDGILSRDQKLLRILGETSVYVRDVFGGASGVHDSGACAP